MLSYDHLSATDLVLQFVQLPCCYVQFCFKKAKVP